ncbi:hypothetical protein [Mycobacterium sp.]|uniref:hypothetical protein n=1 Tax=Mycobacterium sp. TaxID=1785 RepID=UPI002D97690A|nr:hypothetical protein [Mycobacterium sp.]
MSPLIGLYYPFSLPLSDETLKRALLIFDEVLFIDPQTPRVRAGLYDERSHQQHLPLDAARWQRQDWEASQRTLEPLIAAGIARYIDPTPLLDDQPTQQNMTACFQAEMAREQTFALFGNSPTGWCVLRSRIPRSAFAFLHHQYSPRVFYDQNIRRPFSSENGFHALFADGKPDQEFGLPPGPGATPDTDHEYACVVPYYLGSSLAVSLALAACEQSGAIPFTDSIFHTSLLKMRLAAADTAAPVEDESTFLDAALSAEDLAALSLDQVAQLRALLQDIRRTVAESGLEAVVGRVHEAFESIASRQPEAASQPSASRLVRLPAEQPPQAHLEIDPATREFAPSGHNLQLWPRPPAAVPEPRESAPDPPSDVPTQVREPRRAWWSFWKRST